jgi:hypothetical protein
MLNLGASECTTLTFEEYYKPPKDPLKELIAYMRYLRERYRVLQNVIITCKSRSCTLETL